MPNNTSFENKSPSSIPLADGQIIANRFQIESLQGQGRYGLVYQAKDLNSGQLIALKVLNNELTENPTTRDAFVDEVNQVKSLIHPNIIRLYDYFEENQLHFVTMDWIEGDSLEDIMASEDISSGQSLDIIQQLLDGLAFAESKGIQHLDIKPENIMLNNKGQLFIADFGLSLLNRNMKSTLTKSIPYFAPPEYITHSEVNKTTDLYAAGVLFYQLCCRQLPFKGRDIETLIAQKKKPSITFNPRNTSLKKLKNWIKRLIAAKVSERPQSTEAALEQYFAALEKRNKQPLWFIIAAIGLSFVAYFAFT